MRIWIGCFVKGAQAHLTIRRNPSFMSGWIAPMDLRFTEKGLAFIPDSHEVLWFRLQRVGQ